jgi:glycosyltransferase involved in cell wall biosynthesis
MSRTDTSPRISVVLPTYQGDEWITGCLDSLAAQTLGRDAFEVVVVANGPRTRTPELVDAWHTAHPGFRLRLIETEQAGVSHARNLGLDAAEGEYVAFVDDDDRAAPRMLEALLAAARPGVVPMAPVGFFDDGDDEPDFENWYTGALRPFVGVPATNASLYPALTGPWAKLVPAELARRARFPEDLRVGEDRVLWLRVFAAEQLQLVFAGWSAASAYHYRVRDRSASGRGETRSWEGFALPWLDAAAALHAVDVRRAEARRLREVAHGYVFGTFLRSYLAEQPGDLTRFRRALAERGLLDDEVPWRSAHDELAAGSTAVGSAGEPQVTVVVPSYGDTTWLREALVSALEQSLAPARYELIVVENGPRNGADAIVAELAAAHPEARLRHLHTEQAGLCHARNVGIDHARGDYVTFLDDDDRIGRRFLERLLAHADRDRIVMAPAGWVRDDDFARPSFDNPIYAPLQALHGTDASELDLHTALKCPWSKLVATDLARAVRFDEEIPFGEDLPFWLAVLATGRVRIVLGDPAAADVAYLYRIRPGSMMAFEAARTWELVIGRNLPKIQGFNRIAVPDAIGGIGWRLRWASVLRGMTGWLAGHPEDRRRTDEAVRELDLRPDDRETVGLSHVLLEPHPGPKVGVVVTTRGDEHRLAACLTSLATQSLPHADYEIVVVEHGSRGAERSVERLRAAHPGVQVGHRHLAVAGSAGSAGSAGARNLGLDDVRAPYVTFVDDEDRVGPWFLEELLAHAGPGNVVVGLAVTVPDTPAGRPAAEDERVQVLRAQHQELPRRELLDLLLDTVPAKLVSTDVARRVRFADEVGPVEGADFWLRALAAEPLRLVPAGAEPRAAYLHRERTEQRSDQGADWERTVAPRLTALAGWSRLPIADPAVASLRERLLAETVAALRPYAASNPGERPALERELDRCGLTSTPWRQLLDGGSRRELLLVAEEGLAVCEQVLAGDTTVDLCIYAEREITRAEIPGAAAASLRHIALTGPAVRSWADVDAYARTMLRDCLPQVLDPSAHVAVTSISAGPAEHLAAALVKITHPGLRWTARLLPGGEDFAVEADGIFEILAAGLVEAGFAGDEVPEDVLAFVGLVIDHLADDEPDEGTDDRAGEPAAREAAEAMA